MNRWSRGAWAILREAARHVLRRPVVGVLIAGRVADGRWLLIRRGDTGDWALPGGTLEWGETLLSSAHRELLEETGATFESEPELCGVYSQPDRDLRFHAVTVVVRARVSAPAADPRNPLEIRQIALFDDHELPEPLSYGMSDMLADARHERRVLE